MRVSIGCLFYLKLYFLNYDICRSIYISYPRWIHFVSSPRIQIYRRPITLAFHSFLIHSHGYYFWFLSEREPSGYEKVYLEVFLNDINDVDVYSYSAVLLELKHRKAVSLKFQEAEKMKEFRKNISALIYEIKHRPKETISYNIVAEFSLAEDGTILVKCPYCGAPAPLNSKDTKIVCKYCGKTYIIPKKILDLLTN